MSLCCAQDNNPSEESTNQAETDATGDVPNMIRTENNKEKQSTQYLTRFGNVPTSSGQGREILLIQQSMTNYSFFKEFSIEIFSGIQYIRTLALIYSHRVPEFLGNPSWIRSKTENESESQKESQNASVGRPAGRPDPNREQPAFIRSTGQSTVLCHGRPG